MFAALLVEKTFGGYKQRSPDAIHATGYQPAK
jgi:hypothetical protein